MKTEYSRRNLLLSGLSVTAVAPLMMSFGTPNNAGFAPVSSLNDLSPLECFTRLRCSQPGNTTTWWYSGHMLGKVDGEAAVPILSVIGASQSTIEYLDNNVVRYSLIEAGYYGDPDTGVIAEGALTNRLTGGQMSPEHYLSPQSLDFLPDRTIKPASAKLPPGLDYNGRIIGPDIKAGRVWMAEELFVKIAPQGNKSVRILTSMANFEGKSEDIIAGGSFIPASFEYTTWNSFRPWMNMGDAKGAIMMRLNSTKLADWSGLPPMLRERIQSDHPGAFFSV